ncbi:hypothetical protein LCGC14_0349930 [marine sediment metagenome]|uniref:DUF5681 domain-containing protein n=1 Tax=marine sediment metagenome TaxID=412755 RepID=A0A0F9VYG4_9ZZZZ
MTKPLRDPFSYSEEELNINEGKQGHNKAFIDNQWKPQQSGNPNGRPPNTSSITYWYKRILAENEGIAAQEIALKAVDLAKKGLLPHTVEITDRTDGRIPTDVNIKAAFIHIGNDYAQLGLQAMKTDLEDRKQRMITDES